MLEKLSHYVSKTFKSATDPDSIFKKFTTPVVTKPVKLDSKDDVVETAIFNADITKYIKRRNTFSDNLKSLYSAIWEQSSKPTRAKLIGIKHFYQNR